MCTLRIQVSTETYELDPVNIPTCRYREPLISKSGVHRCHHQQVRAFGGLVTGDVCNACTLKVSIPDVSAESAPTVSTLERGGQFIVGCTEIPSGCPPAYDCDVVIPYYNGLQWLPQAIDSILWQKDVSCRIHLINDSSPEDDAWIRKRYRAHPSLIWYRNASNIGPFHSLHRVWDRLQSKYVAIQDADDVSLPNRLWRAIHALESSGAEIYGAAMEQFVDPHVHGIDRGVIEYARSIPIVRSRPLTGQIAPVEVVNGTMVCRRATFEQLNGFADFRCGSDNEFIARAAYAGVKFFLDDRVVALRRLHSENISRSEVFGVDTDYSRNVRASIKDLESAYQQEGRGLDARRFGALNRQRRSPQTVPLNETRLRKLACVRTDAAKYLKRNGFVGPVAGSTPALLPLVHFADWTTFYSRLSKNVRRDARTAANRGLCCHPFEPRNHVPDLLEISRSQPIRQGRPMRDTLSERFREDERHPRIQVDLDPIQDARKYAQWFGIFQPQPGYRQGDLETSERLLAFILLNRQGELAFYSTIMGHGDFLNDGIMFALHLHLIKLMLDRSDGTMQGIKYLMYSAWADGGDGLRRWKERAGFEPHCLEAFDSPATSAGPLKAGRYPEETLVDAQSAAGFFCSAFAGENDIVHYRSRGIRDVVLVDADYDKLAAMQRVYPDSWDYVFGDAFEAVRELSSRRTFDVVTCDEWSEQFEMVALERFADFFLLAKRHLVITLVPRWADGKGLDAEWFATAGRDYSFYLDVRNCFDALDESQIARRLSDVLSKRHGFPINVQYVMRRTDYLGGCYWLVINKQS